MRPSTPAAARKSDPPSEGAALPESVVKRLGPVVLRVFSHGDFHRVDMRTIAKEAGMSFTTIYRYFKDKETLLFWFIAHWLEDLTQAAIDAMDRHEGDPMAQLKQCVKAHFGFYETNPEVGRIIFMTVPLERWMRDPTYRYEAPVRRIFAVISGGQKSGVIRNDISTHLVMDLIFGLFNRTFLMWEYHGRKDSLVDKSDACFELLRGGIAKQPTP